MQFTCFVWGPPRLRACHQVEAMGGKAAAIEFVDEQVPGVGTHYVIVKGPGPFRVERAASGTIEAVAIPGAELPAV